MGNDTVIIDSIRVVHDTIISVPHANYLNIELPNSNGSGLLDILFKLATILIAIANFVYAIIIFVSKSKKDDGEKEKDRKIHWFKTVILDQSLDYLYESFEEIDETSKKIKLCKNDEEKSVIDEELSKIYIKIRRKFIDGLLAVNNTFYNEILAEMDALQTHITNSIFDEGLNLNYEPKFEEIITEEIIKTKTSILKKLFNYRG
ncbi:MAG: hypothetical protein PHR83_01495 [Paludibacter sp.]|nr:hypothetical protein [Paludibacter sp.]